MDKVNKKDEPLDCIYESLRYLCGSFGLLRLFAG